MTDPLTKMTVCNPVSVFDSLTGGEMFAESPTRHSEATEISDRSVSQHSLWLCLLWGQMSGEVARKMERKQKDKKLFWPFFFSSSFARALCVHFYSFLFTLAKQYDRYACAGSARAVFSIMSLPYL